MVLLVIRRQEDIAAYPKTQTGNHMPGPGFYLMGGVGEKELVCLQDIAREHNLLLIEETAQAFSGTYNRRGGALQLGVRLS